MSAQKPRKLVVQNVKYQISGYIIFSVQLGHILRTKLYLEDIMGNSVNLTILCSYSVLWNEKGSFDDFVDEYTLKAQRLRP